MSPHNASRVDKERVHTGMSWFTGFMESAHGVTCFKAEWIDQNAVRESSSERLHCVLVLPSAGLNLVRGWSIQRLLVAMSQK
jgi:hypothetical protein